MGNKSKGLSFIDIFSGAGGLSCGLEQAGHKCLLGVDFDKNAMETFALNHKNSNVYCGDIKKLTKSKLLKLIDHQEIDIVVGGPPCQGFSTVGKGNPNDDRNSLFNEFVRVVRITKPLFVVMENVTGLVAKKNEKTLRSIFQRFERLGYHMDVKVLSSEKYGVPEKRRRTIIIGSKINEKIIFPKETHDTVISQTYRPSLTVGDALKEIKKAKKIKNHDIELAQIKNTVDFKRIKRIPEGKGIRYEEDEKKYLTKSLKLDLVWSKLPEGRLRQTKYQRLDRKKPSPTIMTHRHSYYHPTENRYLTAREAASIQSFPTHFVFCGSVTSQWRQIGNAVPPKLAKAIGVAINQMLIDSKTKNTSASKKSLKKKISHVRQGAFAYQA